METDRLSLGRLGPSLTTGFAQLTSFLSRQHAFEDAELLCSIDGTMLTVNLYRWVVRDQLSARCDDAPVRHERTGIVAEDELGSNGTTRRSFNNHLNHRHWRIRLREADVG